MKWPFARHAHSPHETSGDAGSVTTAEPARPAVVSTRRDWATLPPLKVAGGRPISLTAATRAFTEGLVTQQVLVRSPRLEMVRQIDAPSGSFRGVLAAASTDHDSAPALQEASPLPPIEHRHVGAVAGEHGGEQRGGFGLSAVEHLLAIGDPGSVPMATTSRPEASSVFPTELRDEGSDGSQPGGRRAGLADSRRRGLGPAYHGPLPEAMRAERERDDASVVRPDGDGGASLEPVPGDVRATMRDVLGIDVGDRLVHRGPAVSAEAQAMGAQAFTRDGQVYLADDVGPLDQAKGRAALAHELTHAAQQIVHGVLHDETSDAGRAMEAHAQRVEQFVRGDGGAIKPTPDLLHARPTTNTDSGDVDVVSSAQQMMREMVDSGLAKSDGTGWIVFTMPPSSMTASAGSQRLAGDAPTAHAASQTHWDPLGSFGNTLSQGLGNDMLGIAGSMFGFSDEFMGEQRHELTSDDRQFRRQQTTNAFTELRMEHLRRVELSNLNDTEARHDLERSSALTTEMETAIETRVNNEVTERLALLEAQTTVALERLNQQRTTRREAALLDVPLENFSTALTTLFDNAEDPVLPAEAALLATLVTPPTTPGRGGGATRPGGAAPTARAPGTAPGTGAGTTTPRAAGTTPATPAGHGDTSTGTGAGTGTGTGAAATDQEWRTADTMGGRFEGLGNALVGDIANAEIGFFGSLLGFDSGFEQSLHDDVNAPDTAGAAATATTPHADAAHPDAAHAAAATHAATAAGAAHPGAAHETVDHIVADPYALDELAMRLYPNIRSRLRQELLIDRERAGLLADFR